MEFDTLRETSEARMIMGSGFPDEFAPAPRMQNAALTEKWEDVGSGQFG